MNANDYVKKTERALAQLAKELDEQGETEQAALLRDLLANHPASVFRLAAILAPKN